MTHPAKEISQSPFQPFQAIGGGEAPQAGFDVPRRQRELKAHGYLMAGAMSRGIPDMLRGGVIADGTTGRDKAAGLVRYGTTPRDASDHVGGWRPVTIDGKPKLMRVEMLQTDGTNDRRDGYVEVKFGDSMPRGTTMLVGNEETLRVDIDAQGEPRVSGKRHGVKFNVDYPNPQSMHADLGIADAMFRQAAEGLTDIARQTQIPLGLPELPPAQ